MKFNRLEILQSLDVAKMAIDSRDFIPILSHFCFQGRSVTAYNDFIGIQVAMRTNFTCALQANTLLRLLNSVSTDEVELGFSDRTVFFRSGPQRTGVRARLPFMGEDDFFFKWPNLKRLESTDLTKSQASKLFEGIELCLSSVGDQTPAQMGITLGHSGDYLKMYSTNNKAVSVYSMKDWSPGGFGNQILSTVFCKALLKAASVYEGEVVTFAMADDFVLVKFGDLCKVYGKLVNNKDPLNFEKVINEYLPTSYKTKRQEIAPGLADAFERSLLILSGDLSKQVTVELSLKTVSVEAVSNLGKLKSGSKFAKEFKANKFSVNAELACKAIENATHVFFGDGVMVFSKGPYIHLLSTQVIDQ